MDPRYITTLIALIGLIREGIAQLELGDMESISPELRAKLIADSKALTVEWERLAP